MTTTTKTKTTNAIPHTPYNIIPIQNAVVAKGQRAWAHIKATAAEQRASWVAIGAALAYGKALHPSTKAFGQWVIENGFGDIPSSTRTDAIWLAGTCPTTVVDQTVTHPTTIRKEYNEARKATATPLVDSSMHIQSPTAAPQATREAVWAVKSKVLKVNAHATATKGQEQETAQRYLDKKAAEYGMTTEELVGMAKKLSPEAGVVPTDRPLLDRVIADITKTIRQAASMVKESQELRSPISREYALSLFGLLLTEFTRGPRDRRPRRDRLIRSRAST